MTNAERILLTLDSLPDDVLLHILEFFFPGPDTLPTNMSILGNISQVNQHFRALAHQVMQHEKMYPDCESFHLVVDWYNEERHRIAAERIQ